MKRTFTILVGILFLSASLFAQTSTPPSVGDGSSGNPYEIATLDNLYWITQNSTEWDRYYIQTANIDATSSSAWDAGAGFSPIGNNSVKFEGTYNGQGHTIDGLYINRAPDWTVGVFGHTNSSTIENLGLTNVDITGEDIAGGLVAYHTNNSNINNSYVTGSVTGDDWVGGLVGQNISNSGINNSYTNCVTYGTDYTGGLVGLNESAVSKSYSMGSVSCEHRVGGFIGQNKASISNSFSTCTVNATGMYSGGFVGTNDNGAIYDSYCTGAVTSTDTYASSFAGQNTNASIIRSYTIGSVSNGTSFGGFCRATNNSVEEDCFWNTETSNATSTGGAAIGKTTAEMKNLCTYINGVEASWDFLGETVNGTYDWWGLNANENGGYPYLKWQAFAHTEECCGLAQPTGSGTEVSPYEIATICDLRWLSDHSSEWDKYYIQTADINAAETNTWNVGDHDVDGATPDQAMGFTPIGNNSVEFTGNYDATGYTIDGLYINTTNNDQQGLFGLINGAIIENIAVINANISGDNLISCIVGKALNSTVSNSYSSGVINAYYFTGGIVGENNSSTIENCYSIVDITAVNYAGGITGYNTTSSTINNTYYSGIITSSGNRVGGLVGDVSTSTTTNSFWNTEVSGQSVSDGGIGKTTAEMQSMCIYVDGIEAAWDFMDATTNGSEDIWGINSTENGGLPFLSWQNLTHTGICCGFNQSPPSVTINASATTVCNGEEVTLYGIGATTYTWDNSVSDNVAFIPSGTVNYTVIGNDGNCENTAQIEVKVTPLPTQAIITYSAGELTSSATTGNQWYYTTTLLTGEINQIHAPQNDGEYFVEVTEDGCSIMSEAYNYSTVGIENINISELSIYPNPSNGLVTIEGENILEIEIIDITGSTVRRVNVENNKTTIDLSSQPQGTYFVKTTTKNAVEISKLILK